MGEGTELPPVANEEGVSDQAESKSLNEATEDPVAFIEHEMDIAEAEATQKAFVESVQVTPAEDTLDLPDPPITPPAMNSLSSGPDSGSISSLLPSDKPGELIITETSQPLEQKSVVAGIENLGIAEDKVGSGVSAAGDTERPTIERSDSGLHPSQQISNVSQVQGTRSAEAQGPKQDGELIISEDEIVFRGNAVNSASDVMDRALQDGTEGQGASEAQEALQPMEDLSIAAGGEAPDRGLHESIEADLSVSGVSPEESLRDIVSESETKLGGASKAPGHGVYSKSRELPVSTTGPGGEPEAVMGDLSALGEPKGSESEASESPEQPVMDDISIVAGVGIPVGDLTESADAADDSIGVSGEEGGGDDDEGLFSSSINYGDDEAEFAAIVEQIQSGGVPMDINSLVQSVLRDAYMETSKDLAFHANKVKFYNECKKQVRAYLTDLRGLAEEELPAISDIEATTTTDGAPAEALEDLSIVAGVEIPTGVAESVEGIKSADETSGTGASDSDLENWEDNEPLPPDQDNYDLSTEEGRAKYNAAMEDYIESYIEWAASKPPDEGDDDDGSDGGGTVALPITDPSLDEDAKDLAQSLRG